MVVRLCCLAGVVVPGARGGLARAVSSVAPLHAVSRVSSANCALRQARQSGTCTSATADGRAGDALEYGVVESGSSIATDAPLSLWVPTPADRRVIEERQLGNRVNILGVGMSCKHGCPQAFAFDSLARPGAVYRGPGEQPRSKPRALPLDAGLFRLSCPLLVQAIDEWEREGAVVQLNARVAADGTGALPSALGDAHRKHAAARRALFGRRLNATLSSAPPGAFVRTMQGVAALGHVLDSGIAGQTRGKQDVKCLHAQAADYLCRNRDNAIGGLVLAELGRRGVDVRGNSQCCNQCDLATPLEDARRGWWYEPRKNKWKLRQKARRRHEARGTSPPAREQRLSS